MSKLKQLLRSPRARLVGRALLAGIGYFVSTLQTGGPVTRDALVAAAVGAGWAAVEYVTPLNGVLGFGKIVVKLDPALARFSPKQPPPQP